MTCGLHGGPADVKSGTSFQDTALDEIGPDEIHGRTENPEKSSCLFLAFKIRLCIQFGKMEQLLLEGFWRLVGVMEQVSVQLRFAWCAFVHWPFVNQSFPLDETSSPYPDFVLWIVSAAFNPFSPEIVQSVHGKDLVFFYVLLFKL